MAPHSLSPLAILLLLLLLGICLEINADKADQNNRIKRNAIGQKRVRSEEKEENMAEAKKTKVSDMVEEFFADKQKMSSVLKGIEVVFEIADKYPNTRWLKRAVLVLKIVLQLSQPAIKIYREWLRQERREEPKFLEGLLKSADQATKGKPNEMLEKAKEFINNQQPGMIQQLLKWCLENSDKYQEHVQKKMVSAFRSRELRAAIRNLQSNFRDWVDMPAEASQQELFYLLGFE